MESFKMWWAEISILVLFAISNTLQIPSTTNGGQIILEVSSTYLELPDDEEFPWSLHQDYEDRFVLEHYTIVQNVPDNDRDDREYFDLPSLNSVDWIMYDWRTWVAVVMAVFIDVYMRHRREQIISNREYRHNRRAFNRFLRRRF